MKSKILDSVWIPAKEKSPKVVLVLHGRGDSYHGFTWLPEALALAQVNYLMVNAPDEYYNGFSWYDLPPRQYPGIVRSRSLIDELFAELQENGFDSSDVLLFGFSQGCLITMEWGARSTLPVAGFVAVSGYCYDPDLMVAEMSPEARKARWLVTHGAKDEVLPLARTRDQVVLLKEAGLPLEFFVIDKGHTFDERRELPLMRQWIGKTFNLVVDPG